MASRSLCMKRLGVTLLLPALGAAGCTLLAPSDDDLLPPAVRPGGGGGPTGGTGGVAGSGGGEGGTGAMTGGTGGTTGGTGGTGGVNLCDNDRQDLGETGVDCGGTVCSARCTAGGGCETLADCVSGLACVGRICAMPECDDNQQNGTETGLDCGGPGCDDCPTGQGCVSGTDCVSGVCGTDDRCAAPSCGDDTKNGNETGVDCGGSGNGCMQCPLNETCLADTDCQTQTCAPNLNPPSSACAAGATDCACTACPADIANCNPTGTMDAPQCAEVLTCLLNGNCLSFAECYTNEGSGFCYDIITDRGGLGAPAVGRARDIFENCLVPACTRTCQPLVF